MATHSSVHACKIPGTAEPGGLPSMGCTCSLLGIGERTGNIPLEAMVFEYASLRGSLDGMDPTVITEIADYFRNEIGYSVPDMAPFVGRNFNVTRAGIHADGLMKDEEIYTIFDTKKLLNRPATVEISKTSGLAGIAYWVNQNYRLPEEALELCDGFLVQGGSEFYLYHFQIIHHAVTRGKKYLGICLGQQLIYVYFELRRRVLEIGYEGAL